MRRRVAISCACALPLLLHSLLLAFSDALLERQRAMLVRLWATLGRMCAALPVSAAALLVFSLLYTPCVAAVSAIRRELGGKWAAFVVVGQCAVAWFAALAVRLIGLALGV